MTKTTKARYTLEFKQTAVRLIDGGVLRESAAGDITYIATDEGWLFTAVVIDLFSRQVVGWSLRDDTTRDIAIDAMRIA